MTVSTRVVCFGSSRVRPQDWAYEQALEVGRILAERGLSVCSGGYGGSMEAVSRGAHERGGRVVGITTPIFRGREVNSYVDEELVEPDYPARMMSLLRQGHLYLALPGALGSLAEWMSAWCLATIEQLPGPLWLYEKPWRSIVEAVATLPEVDPAHLDRLGWIRDASDLAERLDGWLKHSASQH